MGEEKTTKKRGERIRGWFNGLKAEFSKIVWPDKKSLGRQTATVVIIAAIVAVIIAILDYFIQYGVNFLINI